MPLKIGPIPSDTSNGFFNESFYGHACRFGQPQVISFRANRHARLRRGVLLRPGGLFAICKLGFFFLTILAGIVDNL